MNGFNHFDPIVDTERIPLRFVTVAAQGFNHFDPIVDTERSYASQLLKIASKVSITSIR